MRSRCSSQSVSCLAYNKAHQFAPSVPDGKTAARFRRRCAVRYGAMRELASTPSTIKHSQKGCSGMKMVQFLCSILLFLIVSGCTITDGSSIVTGTPRNPISTDQVRIYRVAPESYEEIAMVSSSAGHDFKSNSALIDSAIQTLKEEAAKLGANGVLLSNIDERDSPSTSTTYGNANAHGSDGSSVYASGNSVSVTRGDTYTRTRGLAIYVPTKN